jgi:hypothetical protein
MSKTNLSVLITQVAAGVTLLAAGAVWLLVPSTAPPIEWPLTSLAPLTMAFGTMLLLFSTISLATGAAADPDFLRARYKQLAEIAQEDLHLSRRELDQAEVTLSELKSQLQTEAAKRAEAEGLLQQAVGRLPSELLQYYSRTRNGIGELRTAANRVLAPWQAVAGTMSTQPLEPFFSLVRSVVQDAEADPPVHHYSNQEVLRRLELVSDAWRRDQWLSKALRFLQEKY